MASTAMERAAVDVSAQAVGLLDRLVDSRYGIIRSLFSTPSITDGPPLYVFRSILADSLDHTQDEIRRGNWSRSLGASGAALDPQSALMCCIGESVERYAATVQTESQPVHASMEDLERRNERCLPLGAAILYSEEQYEAADFPYAKPDSNTRYQWVEALSLADGKPAYVPSDYVWLRRQRGNGDRPLIQSISTGLAAGSNRKTALLGAICELLERDSFMCHWLLGLSPQAVSSSETSDLLGPEAGKLRQVPHVELRLLDMGKSAGMQIFAAAAVNTGGPRAGSFVLGAAAKPRREEAARKAAVEAFHTWIWAETMSSAQADADARCVEDIVSFTDHVRWYLDPNNAAAATTLIEPCETEATGRAGDSIDEGNRPPPESSDAGAVLDYLCRRLIAAGHDIYVVDLTPPDIAELGLCVVKAVMPTLQPMSCGVGHENLDRRRLDRFSALRGVCPPDALNLAPHPFP